MKYTDIQVPSGEYRVVNADAAHRLVAIGVGNETIFTVHNGEKAALARALQPERISAFFQEIGSHNDTTLRIVTPNEDAAMALIESLTEIDNGTNKLRVISQDTSVFQSLCFSPKTNTLDALQVTKPLSPKDLLGGSESKEGYSRRS